MDAGHVVTNTTTSATSSYLLCYFSFNERESNTAESKSPVGEDEAVTAQSGYCT